MNIFDNAEKLKQLKGIPRMFALCEHAGCTFTASAALPPPIPGRRSPHPLMVGLNRLNETFIEHARRFHAAN